MKCMLERMRGRELGFVLSQKKLAALLHDFPWLLLDRHGFIFCEP